MALPPPPFSPSPDPSSPLKKGPWTAAEDAILVAYVNKHGDGHWNSVQKYSGVSRCGKSCRLRWTNHLRPNLKKGSFSPQEERTVIELHALWGNRWARIAAQLPGRTDNEIKNFWNTRKKRLMRAGLPLYPPDITPVYTTSRDNHQQYRSGEQREGISASLSSGAESESEIVSSPATDFSRSLNPISNMKSGGQVSFRGATTAARTSMKPCGFHQMGLNMTGIRGSNCAGMGNLSGTTNSVLGQAGGSSIATSERRLKRLRDSPNLFNGEATGAAFQRFSEEPISFQPFLKTPCLYDRNAVRLDAFSQGFPYDPDPAEFKSSSYSFPGSSLTSCMPFSIPRPVLSSLKVELPSVQLAAESADSAGTPSSALSSPFASCHALPSCPISETDSFGCSSTTTNDDDNNNINDNNNNNISNNNNSNINNFNINNNNNLLEALLQQAQGLDGIDQVDQLLVMTSSNNSPDAASVAANNPQRSHWMGDIDPLSFLGGRSLSLFSDDLKETVKCEDSSSITCNDSALLAVFPAAAGGDDPNVKTIEEPFQHAVKTEEQGIGVYNDEELLTLLAFERPDALPVGDLYDQTALIEANDRDHEVGCHGGLGAIFGQEVALELEQLGAVSNISNAWELGSCVWNNMPGALQVGELPSINDCRLLNSSAD